MIPGDTYKHQGLRKKLVETIKGKGINSDNVLEAIGKIPRHLFMDNAFLQFAYQDKAFPIGSGQTISQPYTVAFQSELLEVKKGDKVLEIGTGSGYQTAVLLELGARVFSIERQKYLFDKTKVLLGQLNYRPRLFYGDGYKGLPPHAPFDKIIVTAGAPYLPSDLIDQLKSGGRIVIPIGEGDTQKMKLLIKNEDGQLQETEMGDFKFVPLLENKDWKSR
ncbi:MAG: protein-L-isoaspartate(D-aspartate) O-methyltransferase [Flavobacteriales bacterium]|nr:protein-L-isoaspartate(D-aspartate) O-methyltransferase [Flavobacteriales bacterium]